MDRFEKMESASHHATADFSEYPEHHRGYRAEAKKLERIELSV